MKPIGVVSSGSSVLQAPIQIFKKSELEAREESFVVIEDISKEIKYLGILRNLRMNDPLLPHSQRSSLIDNPQLAKVGVEVIFENSYVRILGELEDGQVRSATTPPTPRSIVYLVESPSDIKLKFAEGLVVGTHKYSRIEVPMLPEALRYHVGVIGATGTGKSRLVLALVQEVLEKTDWNVIIFDHSGQDYVPYFKEDNIIDGGRLVVDLETLSNHLKKLAGLKDEEDYIYFALLAYLLADMLDESKLSDTQKITLKSPSGTKTDTEVLSKVLRGLQKANYLEDILKSKNWNLNKITEYLKKIIKELGGKEHTGVKYEAKLSIYCRDYIEKSLNNKKITFNDLRQQVLSKRLAVVDLSGVEREEKRSIVASTLSKLWELVDAERKLVNTLIVIDEAHNYACHEACRPSVDLIERSAREGRKWGIGLVLVSQRIIDFSTDVRNNIGTFFFSKLQTPSDLDNLKGVLDLGGIGYDNLAILEQREFFFAGLGNPLKYPILIQVKNVGT